MTIVSQDLINHFPEYADQHGLKSSVEATAPVSPASTATFQKFNPRNTDSISIADKALANMQYKLNLEDKSGIPADQVPATQASAREAATAQKLIMAASLANSFKLPTMSVIY